MAAIDDLLPLRPDVFEILLALAEEDQHGYALLKRAEEKFGRKGQLQPGALYRLLRRLLDEGLVREAPARGDTGRRRLYQISVFGRAVARAEATRLAETVRLSRRLGLVHPRPAIK